MGGTTSAHTFYHIRGIVLNRPAYSFFRDIRAAWVSRTETKTRCQHLMKEEQKNVKVATLAGGCFWCVASDFENVSGVSKITSGYTGGQKENPTYEEVSTGKSVNKIHKDIAVEFLNLIGAGRPKEGLRFVTPDCKTHNPYVIGGMDALIDAMNASFLGPCPTLILEFIATNRKNQIIACRHTAFRSDKKLKNGKAVGHEIAEVASVYRPIREIFPFHAYIMRSIDGYIDYKRREYCNDVKCPVQSLLNKEVEKSPKYEEIRAICASNCMHSTYEFHHWLTEKGYLIVRAKQK